jgi:hypothetical protein
MPNTSSKMLSTHPKKVIVGDDIALPNVRTVEEFINLAEGHISISSRLEQTLATLSEQDSLLATSNSTLLNTKEVVDALKKMAKAANQACLDARAAAKRYSEKSVNAKRVTYVDLGKKNKQALSDILQDANELVKSTVLNEDRDRLYKIEEVLNSKYFIEVAASTASVYQLACLWQAKEAELISNLEFLRLATVRSKDIPDVFKFIELKTSAGTALLVELKLLEMLAEHIHKLLSEKSLHYNRIYETFCKRLEGIKIEAENYKEIYESFEKSIKAENSINIEPAKIESAKKEASVYYQPLLPELLKLIVIISNDSVRNLLQGSISQKISIEALLEAFFEQKEELCPPSLENTGKFVKEFHIVAKQLEENYLETIQLGGTEQAVETVAVLIPQINNLLEGYGKQAHKKSKNEFATKTKEEQLQKFFSKCSELISYRIAIETKSIEKINKEARAFLFGRKETESYRQPYEQKIKKYQLLQNHIDEMKQNFLDAWSAGKQIVLGVDEMVYELGLSCELRKQLDEIFYQKSGIERICILKDELPIIDKAFVSDDLKKCYENSIAFMGESQSLTVLIRSYLRWTIKQALQNVLYDELTKLSKETLSASELRKKLDEFFSEKSPVDKILKNELLSFDKSLVSDALKKWDELKKIHVDFLLSIDKELSLDAFTTLIQSYLSWTNEQAQQEVLHKEQQISICVEADIQAYAVKKTTPVYRGFFRKKLPEPKPVSIGQEIVSMFLSCIT